MRVGIVGAGAIGRFVAVELAEGGADVVVAERRKSGAEVTATRVDGRTIVARTPARLTTDLADLREVDAVLVAVKSRDSAGVAELLEGAISDDAVVVSLQNGLDAVGPLRKRLGARVAAGVVTYNVFLDASLHARQATSGKLMFEALDGAPGGRLEELARVLRAGGDQVELRRDIREVQAGKLLVNLNNGVCAATGLSIAGSLRDADARACFSACIEEGLRVFRAAGLRPARVTALPPALLALALRLPNFVVMRLARRLASVDEGARSSTLQDLDRGRATEIDDLNGAIVQLAARAGQRAPVNERIATVVKRHEADVATGKPPNFLAARELRASLS